MDTALTQSTPTQRSEPATNAAPCGSITVQQTDGGLMDQISSRTILLASGGIAIGLIVLAILLRL